MTSITRLFDKSLIISRLRSAGGNKTSFQTTATVDGALQNRRVGRFEKSTNGILTSREWTAYVDISEEIHKGDKLVYGGRTFYVDDITPHDYGINQHQELLLRESNE